VVAVYVNKRSSWEDDDNYRGADERDPSDEPKGENNNLGFVEAAGASGTPANTDADNDIVVNPLISHDKGGNNSVDSLGLEASEVPGQASKCDHEVVVSDIPIGENNDFEHPDEVQVEGKEKESIRNTASDASDAMLMVDTAQTGSEADDVVCRNNDGIPVSVTKDKHSAILESCGGLVAVTSDSDRTCVQAVNNAAVGGGDETSGLASESAYFMSLSLITRADARNGTVTACEDSSTVRNSEKTVAKGKSDMKSTGADADRRSLDGGC